MNRTYKVMVLQEDGMAKMYQTQDPTMHRAISAIEGIHALQYPSDKFRVTYIEEVIE